MNITAPRDTPGFRRLPRLHGNDHGHASLRRSLHAASVLTTAMWVFIALFGSGCSRSDDQQQRSATPAVAEPTAPTAGETSGYFEDAMSRVARKDYAGAMIQFRNVLQVDPNNLVARIELGKALLAEGNVTGAEQELLKARELGAHPDVVSLPLIQTLLEQGKYAEVDREASRGGRKRSVESRIQVLWSLAHLRRREVPLAEETLRRAHELDPSSAEPLLNLANIEFERGNTDAARELVDRAERAAPTDATVWAFRGRLHIREHAHGEALDAYRKAHELDPDNRGIRSNYARALLLVGNLQQSVAELEALYDPASPDPEVAYVYALALAQQGDLQRAREIIDGAAGLLTGVDTVWKTQNPQLLMLTALVAYLRGDLELANSEATMLVQVMPQHIEARYLLAQIQLRLGAPADVVTTLAPITLTLDGNGPMLLVYGEALRRVGRHRDARPVLEQAIALLPESVQGRVALAQTHIALQNLDEAIRILEQTTASGEQLTLASGTALIDALMRDGDRERASKVAATLLERFPESAQAGSIAGTLQLAQGDLVAARSYFEQALRIDATHDAARIALAQIELQAGNLDAAAGQFAKILEAFPDHIGALFGLATVAERRGDRAEAVRWLEKLRALAPKAENEILHLVDLYVKSEQLESALLVAEGLASSLPESAAAHLAHGHVLALLGRSDRARTVLRRGARFAGYDVVRLKQIAALQLALEDTDGARASLNKVLQSAPDDAEAAVELIRVEMGEARYDAALERTAALDERYPGSGLAEFLRAEITTRAGRDEEALAHYEQALAVKPDVNIVERIHAQQLRLGKYDEAIASLQRWLETYPGDERIAHLLAATYLQAGDFAHAEPLLRELHEKHPDNPHALNNLAWLLTERGDPDGLSLAAEAYRLAPSDASVLDTYGWALVKDGQHEKGLEILREAVARGGETPAVQYHLAYALERLQRTDEALDILQRLLASVAEFPERVPALALRDSLGR